MSYHEKAKSLWEQVLKELSEDPEINDISKLKGFMDALTPQLYSGNSLILSVDNEWAQNYINTHYKQLISKTITKIVEDSCEVIIVLSEINNDQQDDDQQSFENTSTNQNNLDTNKDINTGLFAPIFEENKDNIERSYNDNQPNDELFHNFHNQNNNSIDYEQSQQVNNEQIDKNIEEKIKKPIEIDTEKRTFNNFVVANTNSYAYGAAYSVAENPGVINNPLFIYGRSGLGKTHLLLAIKNYINENYPSKKVYYSPATNLVEDYVNALSTNQWTDFTDRYRTADVLLIDDVQFLEGAIETTNEFFKIFNNMISKKKHIVLSADRAPKDINLDERLKSRFANGVTADIQAPRFETKMTIFQNYIENLKNIHSNSKIEIPYNVITRVVELSNSNIRNLEGAAASLVVYIAYGRKDKNDPITIEEAEEIVSKIFFTNISEKVSISDIQRFVENYYNVSHGELLGKQRPRNVSLARQVGMYLSRVLTQSSYPEIGKAFKKDHSSVVHAYKNIENRRQSDKEFFNELERMADLIISSSDN